MKKLILTIALLQIFSARSFSQLADENFDYAAGDSLQQHGWITIGTVFTNKILITSPGLSFPSYYNSGIGNAVTIDTTGQDVFKDFTSVRTSGNIFASFLVNVKNAKSGGDYFTGLLSSTSSTSFAGRVFAKDSSGKVAFGLSKTTDAVSYTPAEYFKDTTYLLILKYSINSGTLNDSVSLFVYSSSASVPSFEPLPALGPKGSSGADLTDAGRISLRQGSASNSPKVVLDGIFVTNTWDNSALPVELSSFSYSMNNNNVNLFWTTVSEVNNSGFDIEKSMVNSSPHVAGQNSNVWNKIGSIAGNGTTTAGYSYSFTDRNLSSGKYNYRLKQIDFNGNFEYFDLMNEVEVNPPVKFSLLQNYPNPFNPKTVISYKLSADGFVTMIVYDILGNEISTLVSEKQNAGTYSVNFDGSNLASGVYFYKLETSGFSEIKRMTLIK